MLMDFTKPLVSRKLRNLSDCFDSLNPYQANVPLFLLPKNITKDLIF